MLHWREFTPAVVAMVTGQQARPQTDGESVDFARGGTMAPTRPSPGHLTVEQLQTFAVIARSESFRKAAEDLFLSQPAMTERVNRLERCVDVELFDRTRQGRTIALTRAGLALLRFADSVQAQWERTNAELATCRASQAPAPAVTVACPMNASARAMLFGAIAAFQGNHPGERVSIVYRESGDLVPSVLRGEADACVVHGWQPRDGLDSVLLHRDRLVLIGPPDGPLEAIEEESEDGGRLRLPFVAQPHPFAQRVMAERWADAAGISLDIVCEVASYDGLREAVASGVGYTMISSVIAADEIASGRVRLVRAPGLPRRWDRHLVFRVRPPLSEACREFVEAVRVCAAVETDETACASHDRHAPAIR